MSTAPSLAPRRRALATPPDAAFAALFEAAGPDLPGGRAMAERRRLSFERFAALGFPTPRAEDWRYSGLPRLVNQPLALAAAPAAKTEGAGFELRMVDGAAPLLPERVTRAGMTLRSLASLLEAEPDKVGAALAAAPDGDRSLSALNAAFLADGLWVELEEGARPDGPLRLDLVSQGAGGPAMSHPRLVLRLGAGAKLALVERHGGEGGAFRFTNLVIQAELGPGAVLIHDRLQLLPGDAALASRLDIKLAAGARYLQTAVTMGGAVVRNETEARIQGAGVDCLLNGAYLTQGDEQADTFIRVHHEAGASHSDQFYKGVVDGGSRAAFQGKIIVHEDAQKTNAFQQNSNLLLSNDAELDTKPELEIYADDVKCSHGATSGDLDPQALFYLRSRGLDTPTARSLLTYAFAAEVLERLSDEELRHEAQRAASARLPGTASLMEAA